MHVGCLGMRREVFEWRKQKINKKWDVGKELKIFGKLWRKQRIFDGKCAKNMNESEIYFKNKAKSLATFDIKMKNDF